MIKTRRRYSEHAEQCALIKWVRLHEHIDPRLKLLYAIPNGEKRTKAVAARLKREGVLAGVYDICLPVLPCERFEATVIDRRGSLYIEMKSRTGRISDAQDEWAILASHFGAYVRVAYSWTEAAAVICSWLGNPKLKAPK